MRVIVIVTLQ